MSGLRRAVRVLLRTPLVTAFAILSLALAIGANTAAFGVLNALLLRTIAVPNPRELVAISADRPDGEYGEGRVPLDFFRAVAAESRLFAGALAWQGDYPLVPLEANGVSYASTLARVGGDYFGTLGIRPFLGRFFAAAERDDVAVIDYRCWDRRFHRDPAVIGKTIRVEGLLRTIVGVTAESFTGMEVEVAPEVTVPMGPLTRVAVVARLRPGVTAEAARARLDALWSDPQRRIHVQPFATGFSFLRDRQVPTLKLLLGLAASVLLIASLNLANLMLARASARRHELGIRIALGAGRWSLLRGLLAESLILAAAGGVLGLLFAVQAGRWLVSLLWTGLVSTAIDPVPDFRVLAFSAAISIAAGLLFGMAPTRALFRLGPIDALRGNPRAIAGSPGRFGGALVSIQFALSLVLVAGSLLLVRGLHQLRAADLGFRRDHVLMVRLFPQARGPIPNRAAYYRELADSLRALPGVESVAYSGVGPIASGEMFRPVAAPDVAAQAVVDFAGPGFFRMIGMRLLDGREFAWSDHEQSPRVAIVSQSLATRLFGAGNAVGRSVVYDGRPQTIVGVVSNASLWSTRTHNPMAIYFPLLQDADANGFWIDLRASGDPALLANPVRRALESMGRHIPIRIQTLDEHLDFVLARERMTSALAGFLGFLAVLLATVGIYGVTWNAVARRTPEFGVRMALGAQPGSVAGLVLRGVLKLVVAGVVAGIPAALWSSKLIADLMVGVPPRDFSVLLASSALLAVFALAAAWFPARRAARVDPIQAIRCE
jgi:putative ABC transport system permease protein